MRKKDKLVFTVFALALVLALELARQHGITTSVEGLVTHIADGDTISVVIDSKIEKVRILGIDCPELAQPFGPEAKERVEALALGKTVSLEWRNRDKYGRVLGDVTLPSGENLAHVLVSAGLAWRFRGYKDAALAKLEAEAKAARRGLWSRPNPVPPWEYRAAR